VVGLTCAGCTEAPPRVFPATQLLPATEAKSAAPALPDTTRDEPSSAEPDPEPIADPEPLLDAWSMAAQEDGAACREALKAQGFGFQAYPDRTQPDGKTGCGIPHGVVVVKGPTGIRYEPPITVDCTLARSLAAFERIVQEESETHLHTKVSRIGNLGGFACRPRNSRKGGSLSAHAFGNAVDVSAFHLASGASAVIARDYGDAPRTTPARDDRRRFLHAVYGRLRSHETDLTYIVGPDFNRAHHDHFHLDRGGWKFWFERQ
jgi:hypothetical protein